MALLINVSILPYKKKKGILLFFTFVQLYFIHAFKDPYAFNDAPHYALAYDIMCNYGLMDYFTFANIKSTEYSYILLMYVSSLICSNTQFIFIVTSFLILSGYFFLIEKYSAVIWASIFLFFITDYQMSLFVLRQFCAISILAYSIPYIIKRNFLNFCILQLIAFYFHFTSIVFFPLYFAYGFNLSKSKKQCYLFFTLAVLCGLFFRVVYTYLGLSSELGYSSYMEAEGGANNKMFLLLLLIFLLYVYSYKKDLFIDDNIRLIFYILFIGMFIAFWGTGLIATSRLNLYYSSLGIILGIPKLLTSKKSVIRILGWCIIAALFYFYCKNLAISEQQGMFYKFCFM